jgi:shikimate dehydrogenase
VVIGDPVDHSKSPAVHNAAFAAAGLDWVFVALRVPAGEAAVALAAMRTMGLAGMSVTMPHKEAVAGLVDRCAPLASRLGAVNCVARDGDLLVGHNTDASGFVSWVTHTGCRLDGAVVAVVGAGGAARAVIAGALDAGAARVLIVARSPQRAAAAVVVNATPVGMAGSPGLGVPASLLRPDQVVADLVYHPVETELLRAAREIGAVALDGRGMLVHQAAHAFALWTGVDPPLAAMLAAVET